MRLFLQYHSKSSNLVLLLLLGISLLVGVQARNSRHGNRPPLGLFDPSGSGPEFVSKTCSADFACPLRRRQQDDQESEGTFVCRTTYHPFTGTTRTQAICIPPDRAFESDECGCCGEDCPTPPEFQEITCTDQEDLLATLMMSRRNDNEGGFDPENNGNNRRALFQGGGGGFGGGGGGGPRGGQGGFGGGGGGGFRERTPAIVCRTVYNPFTGDQERVTIPIPSTKSLDGDVCGCCDGICPDEISRRPFERPQQVELDWCDASELTTCTLPKRRRNPDSSQIQDEVTIQQEDSAEQGVFVCRSRANPLTADADTHPVCISTDAAWESDQCGCCGQVCPERPARADDDWCSDAQEEQVECSRRNGRAGVFVCRSLFHPLEGNLVDTTLCIPEDKAFATDGCGCCEDGCPVTSSTGFEEEDVQIMAFAMSAAGAEVTSTTTNGDGGTTNVNAAADPASSGVSRFSFDAVTITCVIVSMIGAILIW